MLSLMPGQDWFRTTVARHLANTCSPTVVFGLVLFLALAGSICTAQDISSFPPDPPFPEVNPNLGNLLQEADQSASRGDFIESLKTRESVITLAQNPLMRNQAAEGWARYGEGRDFASLNQIDKALAAEKHAIQIFDELHFTVGKFEALVSRGTIQLQANDPGADATFQQALDLARAETKWPAGMSGAISAAGSSLTDLQPRWAKEFLKAQIALCDKFAKPPAYEKASAEGNLARIEMRQGDYEEAARHLQAAREIDSKTVQTLWPNLARMESERVNAERSNDAAIQQQLQAQEQVLQNSISTSANYALMSLNGLIAIDINRGYIAAAREKLSQADAEIEKYHLNSAMSSDTLLQIANLAMLTGELQNAGSNLRLTLSDASHAGDFSTMTRVLVGLGRLSLLMQNIASAGDYLQVARELINRVDPEIYNREMEVSGLVAARESRNASSSEKQRRERATAQKDLNAAILFYRTHGWKFDLARALRQRVEEELNEDAAGDRADVKEAQAILDAIAPASFEAAHLKMVEGNLAYGDDFATAEKDYRASLKLTMELAPRSFGAAALMMNLGKTLSHEGQATQDPAQHKRLLTESDAYIAQGWRQARDLQAEFYGDEASQYYAIVLSSYATDYAEVQIANGDNAGAFVTVESSRALGLEQLLVDHRKITGELWSAHKYLTSQRHKTEADFLAAMDRRAAAAKTMAELQHSPPPVDQQKLKQAQQELDAAYDEEDRASAIYIENLVGYDEFWSQVQKEVAKSPSGTTATQAASGTTPAFDLNKDIAAIPPGTTFVMFAVGRRHILAFGLRGGSSEILTNISDLDPPKSGTAGAATDKSGLPILLSSEFHKFFDRVRSEPATADLAGQVAQLGHDGKQLFAGLFPGKLGDAVLQSNHLVISPDGFLWTLPFAALSTGGDEKSPQYLGLSKPIAYAQSLRMFERSLAAGDDKSLIDAPDMLIVGDPKFDLGGKPAQKRGEEISSYFTPGQLWAGMFTRDTPPSELKATQEEVSAVACYLGAKPLMHTAATEEEVRKHIDDAAIVHLATHGFLYPGLPMSSGLVFAPPADDTNLTSDNDGVLQAWEIFSQLQMKAQMVVLSACETARGWDVQGEGVIGLTRALQYAGAQSILATLWTIDDRSTSDLMRVFYAKLIEGKTKDDALRDGMENVAEGEARQTKPYWKHPYYWAAPTLLGNPGSLHFAKADVSKCQ
jgi:CHAT domain-containing protein